ncbi:MAG: hypothetical protein AAF773_11535 [Cyanobacteria bacterium P01_D01_bin.115]
MGAATPRKISPRSQLYRLYLSEEFLSMIASLIPVSTFSQAASRSGHCVTGLFWGH